MKISRLLSLFTIALALGSIGCSASGRINVQNDRTSNLPTDAQVAFLAKPAKAH